jgi:hypothetical protein
MATLGDMTKLETFLIVLDCLGSKGKYGIVTVHANLL